MVIAVLVTAAVRLASAATLATVAVLMSAATMASVALFAAVVTPLHAAAQEETRDGRFSTTLRVSERVSGVPSAESDAMGATLRRVAGVLSANPLVHRPPPGAFCTWLHAFLPLSAESVVKADAAVEVIPMADGECRRLGGIAAGVEVNNAAPVMHKLNRFGEDLRDDGGTMYFAPRVMAPLNGHAQFEYEGGRFVLLTRRKAPLWIPVSRERYLRAVMAAWETQVAGRIRSAQSQAARAGSESALERWLRKEKPAVLEEQQRTLRELRGQIPAAELEQMRVAFATVIAETEAALREADAEAATAGAVVSEGMEGAQVISAGLAQILAKMTPAERASPACVDYRAPTRDPADAAASLADCRTGEALVYLNPRFFDRALGAGAPQLILVRTSARLDNRDPMNMLRVRIYETTDLDGLAALLR